MWDPLFGFQLKKKWGINNATQFKKARLNNKLNATKCIWDASFEKNFTQFWVSHEKYDYDTFFFLLFDHIVNYFFLNLIGGNYTQRPKYNQNIPYLNMYFKC